MSKWKYSNMLPKIGSKIGYLDTLKKPHTTVVAKDEYPYNQLEKQAVNLINMDFWDNVLMWYYIDEDYNFGEEK